MHHGNTYLGAVKVAAAAAAAAAAAVATCNSENGGMPSKLYSTLDFIMVHAWQSNKDMEDPAEQKAYC